LPLALVGPVELLLFEVLETWQKLKAQQMAERKADVTLAVAINVVLLDLHSGGMSEHAFEHRGDL
jgi:hypothetical protein